MWGRRKIPMDGSQNTLGSVPSSFSPSNATKKHPQIALDSAGDKDVSW